MPMTDLNPYPWELVCCGELRWKEDSRFPRILCLKCWTLTLEDGRQLQVTEEYRPGWIALLKTSHE